MFSPQSAPGQLYDLASYRTPRRLRSLFQLVTSVVPFVLLWWAMWRCMDLSYMLALFLAVPTAGMVVRLFIIQHDCGHGAFFCSSRVSTIVGTVLGIVTLTPYRYWARIHGLHHSHHGKLEHRIGIGYYDLLTVEEYLRLDAHGRRRYRLYRHPLAFLTIGPIYQFFIKHRFPLDLPRSWRREWASVLLTDLAIGAILLLAASRIGLGRFLLIQIPVNYFAGVAGMWLFFVQHNFEEASLEVADRWTPQLSALQSSSFYDLPRVLAWVTGDIGLHHIHHLDSRIPNYRLRECLRKESRLAQVCRLTFWRSLSNTRLALWDQRQGRLVSFREVVSNY